MKQNFEKTKEANEMKDCSFKPNINKKVPLSARKMHVEAVQKNKVEAISIGAIFQYQWGKFFSDE